MKTLSKKQIDLIDSKTKDAIDSLFIDCHQEISTKSGDITPHQYLRLEAITKGLSMLIVEQIEQNL